VTPRPAIAAFRTVDISPQTRAVSENRPALLAAEERPTVLTPSVHHGDGREAAEDVQPGVRRNGSGDLCRCQKDAGAGCERSPCRLASLSRDVRSRIATSIFCSMRSTGWLVDSICSRTRGYPSRERTSAPSRIGEVTWSEPHQMSWQTTLFPQRQKGTTQPLRQDGLMAASNTFSAEDQHDEHEQR
jgi:hypothetical protein